MKAVKKEGEKFWIKGYKNFGTKREKLCRKLTAKKYKKSYKIFSVFTFFDKTAVYICYFLAGIIFQLEPALTLKFQGTIIFVVTSANSDEYIIPLLQLYTPYKRKVAPE